MIIVVLSAAAGMLLALVRFPVFSLVPLIVFSAAGAAVSGIVAGAPAEMIALVVLGSIAAPQFAYLAGSSTAELIRWSWLPRVLGQPVDAERHARGRR